MLIFCDGYDEIGYHGNLYRDNRWDEWPKAKFVVTTRPEKFGNQLSNSDLRHALIDTFSPIVSYNGTELPPGLWLALLFK